MAQQMMMRSHFPKGYPARTKLWGVRKFGQYLEGIRGAVDLEIL